MSFILNPVVGGVMTAQNLKDVQQVKAGRVALWGSIGYTIACLFLVPKLTPDASMVIWLTWLTNLLGGAGLAAYGKRFIPDWQFIPAKSNRKPILICLGITVVLLGLLFLIARPN